LSGVDDTTASLAGEDGSCRNVILSVFFFYLHDWNIVVLWAAVVFLSVAFFNTISSDASFCCSFLFNRTTLN